MSNLNVGFFLSLQDEKNQVLTTFGLVRSGKFTLLYRKTAPERQCVPGTND